MSGIAAITHFRDTRSLIDKHDRAFLRFKMRDISETVGNEQEFLLTF